MTTTIIIPARWGSERLPGKPLADIDGVPMIHRVVSQALQVKGVEDVVVATDDQRIDAAVGRHRACIQVIMTSREPKTGTDRCAEAARTLGLSRNDIIVNVQGDMPFFPPQLCFDLIQYLKRATYPIVTPAIRRQKPQIGGVHVMIGNNDQALYFSRQKLFTDPNRGAYHVGMYAFRNRTLQQFSKLPQSPSEIEESLEQNRALHYGIPIGIMRTALDCGPEVNTPEDLNRWQKKVT